MSSIFHERRDVSGNHRVGKIVMVRTVPSEFADATKARRLSAAR
jgi:hypothetical protein